MLAFENQREIQQGEEWSLDILISQSQVEYIPFIVSSQLHRPFCAITVASTTYEKGSRYVGTWWLNLTEGPGFEVTPYGQSELTSVPLPRFYTTVPDDSLGEIPTNNPSQPYGHPDMYALYRYTLRDEPIDRLSGHKPYHYVYFTNGGKPRYDYQWRIRMTFNSAETSKWNGQNYMYQITLVDTESMANIIWQAKITYPEIGWPATMPSAAADIEDYIVQYPEEFTIIYTLIKRQIPNWFQSDIDKNLEVGRISTPKTILTPTKLLVNSNLRKLI